MRLVARIWAAVTSILDVLTLSPIDHGGTQHPLFNRPPISVSSANIEIPTLTRLETPPVFTPPGARPEGPGSDFTCDYSNMPEWRNCSIGENRECWLRHPDGREFNIHTNYEKEVPVGIDRYYSLTVHDGEINADGMIFKSAKLFNGSFPGPWLQACWGDTVHVKVTNKMESNGTSIHWHGIRQFMTMHMDGVNGLTQCPIAKDDSFVYSWRAMQYGSSWYHSHYSLQYADGLQGPITIHGPASAPFDKPKLPLLMSDWGHNTAFEAVYGGMTNRSIVLNGTGDITRYSGIPNSNTTRIPDIYTLHFDERNPNKDGRATRYLLRLINTAYYSTFIFSIDHHWLQVIQADFVPIEPYYTQSVLVGIGQRYNVIVEANPIEVRGQPPPKDRNFWIRTGVADRCGKPGADGYNKTGVLRYGYESKAMPTSTPWIVPTRCSDEPYESLRPKLPWYIGSSVNGKKGEHLPLQFSTLNTSDPDWYPLAAFSLSDKGDPLRIGYSDPIFLKLNNTEAPWPKSWVVIPEEYTSADWVYLVMDGTRIGTKVPAHPMHLHGHDFAILQLSENEPYSPEKLRPLRENPPRRDVVLLPTNGFVFVAFKADNPGAWLLHCHIAKHASEGLALQILERQADAYAIWPQGDSKAIAEAERVCTNWRKWQGDCKNHWPGVNETGGYPACNPGWWFQDDSGI